MGWVEVVATHESFCLERRILHPEDTKNIEYHKWLIENNLINPLVYCPIPEEWTDITDRAVPGIEPIYRISTIGRILNTKSGELLYGNVSPQGYSRVSLQVWRDGIKTTKAFPMHRLMMLSFFYVDNHEELQVNHKDGVKCHNYITNLEWATPQENTLHAVRTGLAEVPGSKLTVELVHEIARIIESGQYLDNEIAKMYGVNTNAIGGIRNRIYWADITEGYDFSKAKNRFRLTKQDATDIAYMIRDGKSDIEIGARYNVSPSTINAIRCGTNWRSATEGILEFNEVDNIPRDPKKLAQIHEVCRLIETGLYNDSEIGKMVGLHFSTVSNIHAGKRWRGVSKHYDLSKKNDGFRHRTHDNDS